MAKQSLESWIHEAMTDADKEKPISQLSLMHIAGSENEIHTVKFGSKSWAPSELSTLFRHKAESFAQELSGVQTFALLAFYGSGESQARHPFVVTGATDFQLTTENADAKGLAQQGMRHLEVQAQMYSRGQAVILDAQQRLIETLTRNALEDRKENRELIGILKDVVLTQATNNHEHKMKELEYERSSAERKKWIGFLPGLVNNILGKDVFPQSTADTALIESIADNLTPDQLEKLGGALKPEVLGPIADRFNKHFEKRKLESKQAKQLAAKNPEDDAAGD